MMARKKKSNNTIVPVLVLAAILAGGYYWLTSDDGESDQLRNSSLESVDEKEAGGSFFGIFNGEEKDTVSLEIENDNQDTLSNADSSVINQSTTSGGNHPTNQPTTAKNAYVDDYGNVIYTQPNGKSPVKYKTVRIGRWGYSVKYPAFLTKETNGSDGRSFHNSKGVKLTTYASWNVFDESISELYRKDFPDVKSVTYKKLFRKQKCYVKSGYTKNNQIFYLKEAIYEKDGQEVVATLVFYYPKSFNKDANTIVKEIFSNFPLVR